MNKILTILLISIMIGSFAYADQWDKDSPAGTDNLSLIDDKIETNNNSLDRLFANYRRGCDVEYLSASTLTVKSGEIVLSNSAGTTRLFQQNTSDTTVTWSNLDTGSEAASTTYYVYAYQNTTSITTFNVFLSTNSTAPTGATYYKRLGYFTNNSSSNITNVVNDDVDTHQSSQAKGVTSSPTTTSTSYTDLTDMSVSMTTGANPVLILFSGSFHQNTIGGIVYVIIDIDGTDKTESERRCELGVANYREIISTSWLEQMTAGSHTFKVQWKVGNGTGTATTTNRTMQVIELR